MWKWIWPRVGTTPSSQNTDSEMFDRADYPYTETFVREAIQNTLDARLDTRAPAMIRFGFHKGNRKGVDAYLTQAIANRRVAEFAEIPEWENGAATWITIEDFNTKGLDGALDDRLGNFWNYWLNFGVSNKEKEGAKRGGRGIGRVTFLIASRMQTVLGFTRRAEDGATAACGMTLLKMMRTPDKIVHTTHAYLAKDESDDVFVLHDDAEFQSGVVKSFGLTGYAGDDGKSGLALIIPYPYPELTAEGILASSIEHFAPAILGDSLVVEVDGTRLDASTIGDVAELVADKIHTTSIREDVARYLGLVRAGAGQMPELKITVADRFESVRESALVKAMQQACQKGDQVAVKIAFELRKGARSLPVSLRVVVRKTPDEHQPIDRLFREGMSLPEVKATMPGELDMIVLVDDDELAAFLNLCEGKAHLDLLESKEVRAKLEKEGYSTGVAVKRLVKNLCADLRALLTPEITKPETDVFDSFFALPDNDPTKKKGRGGNPDITPPPPPPPPPPRIPALVIHTLDDGFRMTANPAYSDWPINVSVSVAYADGSRKPSWDEYDFKLSELPIAVNDCDYSFAKNKITARNCSADFSVEVKGFDARRELDTNIKVWKNAQND